MSDVKLTSQDFDLNFKDAPDFENLPEGEDPTDELYDFASSAGAKQSDVYTFFKYVKGAEKDKFPDSFSTAQRPCLGNFTHSTYKIDRFGAVFQADWALYRVKGVTQAILKDYDSDEGQSIAPEDLGKVFKGAEFTQAMQDFFNAYQAKMRELKDSLKRPEYRDELTAKRLGELAAAVSKNDLGKVFQILYTPEFVENNLETIKQAVRLHLYLEAGLTLSQNNKDYKITQAHAIKSAIAGTKNPFSGVNKNSGQKQADQVLNKLTQDKVMNELIPLLLNTALYDNMLNEEEPAIESESGESDAVDMTDATDTDTLILDLGPAEEETVPQPQTNASETTNNVQLGGLDPAVVAALNASPAGPIPDSDLMSDGLRESTTADDLAVPTTSPEPITATPEPAAAAPVATPVVEPVAAPVELPVVQPAPVELPPAPVISTEPETVPTSDIIEACTTATPSLDDINVLLKEFTEANRPVNQNGDNPVKEVHTKTGTNRILDQEDKPLKIDNTTYKNTTESIAELRGYLRALLTLKQPEVIVLRDTELSTTSVINYAYTLFAKRTDSGFIDFPKSKTQISDALERNQKLMTAIDGLKAIQNPDDVQSITITGYASAHSESVIDHGKKVFVTDSNIAKYVDPETHTLKPGYTWATDTVPTKVTLISGKSIDNPRFAKERAENLKNFLLEKGVSRAIVDKVRIESKGGAFKPTATLLYTVKSAVNVSFSMNADDITGISQEEKQKVAAFMSDTLNPYFNTMVSEKREEYEDEAELASKAETALQAAAKVILALLNPTTFEKATRDLVATKLYAEMQNNESSVYGAKLLTRVLESQPEFAHLQFAKDAKIKKDSAKATVAKSGIFVAVSAATPKAKIVDGKIIPSAKIGFESGKNTLTKESEEALLDLARFLNQNPNSNIKISGHTDNTGDNTRNIALSEERATKVMFFLINEGHVNQNRLVATGFGESKPIDTNRTSSGRANNRRVEFVIVSNPQVSTSATPAPAPVSQLPIDTQALLASVTESVSAVAGPEPTTGSNSSAAKSTGQKTPDSLNFKTKTATFKVTETEPVFEFNGDETQIKNVHVVFGTKKIPLSFEAKDNKLTVQGLAKYSKAVTKYFQDSDVTLSDNDAKAKAKMAYPIEITLKDGSVIKLTAKGE